MRRCISMTLVVLALSAVAPVSAGADFGFRELGFTVSAPEEASAPPAGQAGSHPLGLTTLLELNTKVDPVLGEIPEGALKNMEISLPPGFVGAPTAVPGCASADFLQSVDGEPECPDNTAVGVTTGEVGFEARQAFKSPVYNLISPPGVAAQIGFIALKVPVVVNLTVAQEPPYNVRATLVDVPQAVRIYSAEVDVWGNPAGDVHDPERGRCFIFGGSCPSDASEKPFLTMPRTCAGPLHADFSANSWQEQARVVRQAVPVTDVSPVPNPIGVSGCEELEFDPVIASNLTSSSAESASGLDFDLTMPTDGLTSEKGIAQADIAKAVVRMPEGVTANPAAANGLQGCSEAALARETLDGGPGTGCPEAAKIGNVEVETPLLEGSLLKGDVYIATPDQNPFGSLLAMYIVIKEPQRGIMVKLGGRIEADSRTGRLVTTLGEAPFQIPQLPFSRFSFHFRSGARAPLVTPARCGAYPIEAEFTPSSGAAPVLTTSSLQVTSGNGGSCPAGPAPLDPSFEAGSLINEAGVFSPFTMRVTRPEGEQDITRLDAVLPPGVVPKLAGVASCPDAAIAAARTKSGSEELASASCPPGSEIGSVLGGSGVGGTLTYVPGKIYLAGPYGNDPLSVAVIVPAVAGPFDIGTVVVREGIALNPETYLGEVDGSASDPIPSILEGIPLKLRDLRIMIDRSQFMLNPTSCDPLSVKATVFGGYIDVFSPADDVSVDLQNRYQAASCSRLGFKPKLRLSLKGKTKRSGKPALKAVLTFPKKGAWANIRSARVALPRSEFLNQAAIRTICTRVQFREGWVPGEKCPKGAVYGFARATSPLLDKPVKGPVFMRASDNPLPDLVAALHNEQVSINLVGRIDSAKGGGIRTTFDLAPDAPVSRFVLQMKGGKRSLLENSVNLCNATRRAGVRFTAQNGKVSNLAPVMKTECGKQRGKGKRGR